MQKIFIFLVLLFTLASATIDTILIRASGGSDANDGKTFATGVSTFSAAHALVDSGDIIAFCADGIHEIAATCSLTTKAFSVALPLKVTSANATGTIDGTQATVTGASLPASSDVFLIDIGGICVIIDNIDIRKATQHNINVGNAVNVCKIVIKNCSIDSAAEYGIYNQESLPGATIELDHNKLRYNTSYALASISNTRQSASNIINNLFLGNGGGIYTGFPDGYRMNVYNNIFALNTQHGIMVDQKIVSGQIGIIKNTFYKNTLDGIRFTDSVTSATLNNNVFDSSLTSYGIYFSVDNPNINISHNCHYGNFSGATNVNGGTPYGSNNITSDPLIQPDFRIPKNSPVYGEGKQNAAFD